MCLASVEKGYGSNIIQKIKSQILNNKVLNLITQIFFVTKIFLQNWTERKHMKQISKFVRKALLVIWSFSFFDLFIPGITSHSLHKRNLSQYKLLLFKYHELTSYWWNQKKTGTKWTKDRCKILRQWQFSSQARQEKNLMYTTEGKVSQ